MFLPTLIKTIDIPLLVSFAALASCQEWKNAGLVSDHEARRDSSDFESRVLRKLKAGKNPKSSKTKKVKGSKTDKKTDKKGKKTDAPSDSPTPFSREAFQKEFRNNLNCSESSEPIPANANMERIVSECLNPNTANCPHGYPIGCWNTSLVVSMANAFSGNTTYNDPIDGWDTSSCKNMQEMFNGASSFNGDIRSWDVSNVTDMGYMFFEASSFNGNISSWDVSEVTNMEGMFGYASSFNQCLSPWADKLDKLSSSTSMFVGSNCTNTNTPSKPFTNLTKWCSCD